LTLPPAGFRRSAPDRYTLASPPEKRSGRSFIDYLRNGRGTMAIGTWSPRGGVRAAKQQRLGTGAALLRAL
jgi:DNA primase